MCVPSGNEKFDTHLWSSSSLKHLGQIQDMRHLRCQVKRLQVWVFGQSLCLGYFGCVVLQVVTRVLTFDAVVAIFIGCLWAFPPPRFFPSRLNFPPDPPHTLTEGPLRYMASCKENSIEYYVYTYIPLPATVWTLTASLKGLSELNSSWESYRFSKT